VSFVLILQEFRVLVSGGVMVLAFFKVCAPAEKNGDGHGFMVFLQLTRLDLCCAGKWQSASNKVVFGGDRQSVGQLLKRC
jgi:hypothetical protein